MRLRKAPKNYKQGVKTLEALTEHERLVWKDVDELETSPTKEVAEQLYVKHVMKPLLGSKYVDAGVRCFYFIPCY